MGWSDELNQKYSWHPFGPEWRLLAAGAMPADRFLQSLDLFVYTLGPFFRESWGRVAAEAMLTGAIPLVPRGYHFGNLVAHGGCGYLCGSFGEYREAAQRLYWDYDLRRRMSGRCASYARDRLCDHRRIGGFG
ncbi:MAG: hypothetical protein M2R45_02842 [Verrucomicrobia subdivision 3 bacterium]|nr:hypothetical protein [Limisphaerales bacterium]MCS1415455.1 hypothetical protein [Limisphaerales bacterium]